MADEHREEWTKCYSRTHKRDYYFNKSTGQSVWSLDDVKERVDDSAESQAKLSKESLSKKSKIKLKAKDKLKLKSSSSVTDKVKRKADASPDVNISKKPKSHKTKSLDTKQAHQDEPMEIDDIIESVNKIRKDTKNEKVDSNLTHLIESTKPEIEAQISIVLDTNILLSHLKSIKEITNESILFVVPWIVVQELDKFKHKPNSDNNIAKKAQEAIRFITSVLQSKSTRFLFENAFQSDRESNLIKCFSPDDHILKCALQMKHSNPESNIYLLTNDKNLLNKSLINQLNSINFEQFTNNLSSLKLQKFKETTQNNSSQFVNKSSDVNTKMELENDSSKQLIYLRNFKIFYTKLLRTIDEQIISFVKNLVSYYYEKNKQLESIWIDAEDDIEKSTNGSTSSTSQDTLNSTLISKIKSFKQILPNLTKQIDNSFQNIVKSIRESVKSYDNLTIFHANNEVNLEEKFKHAIRISIEVLRMFEMFEKNRFDEKVELILSYLNFFNTIGSSMISLYYLSCKFDVTTLEEHSTSASSFELFQPLWEKFHHFSLMLETLLNDPTAVNYLRNDCKLFYQLLISVSSICCFKQLYEDCLNVLNLNHLTSLSLAIYVMNKFYELDTLESDFEQKIDQEFKKYSFIKNCIIKCFQQPNNSETMMNGLIQLDEFKNKFQLISLHSLYQLMYIK